MTASSPLRILHVFRAPVGGLFRHVTDLATEQARAGHAVGVLCDSTTGGAYEAETLAGLNEHLALGLVRVPMRREVHPGDLAVVMSVLRRLGDLAPDVIHGHGAKGGAYARPIATWLSRQRPLARVYTPHGGSLHYEPASFSGRMYFTAERMMERMTDALIHVSAFEADLYRRKVGTPRCLARVIHNGLRPEEFEPVRTPPDAHDLLFLGAFRAIKGIDTLLHGMSRLEAAGRGVTATLVGQPAGRDDYVRLAQALGIAHRVTFRDPLPVRAAMAGARVMVVPSRAESLPYVVLEAAAAAMPLVATRVGGVPEIVGPNVDSLVPPGDSDALAAALGRVLADDARARREADALRGWVRPRFNVAAMQRETEALYREVLARKGAVSARAA